MNKPLKRSQSNKIEHEWDHKNMGDIQFRIIFQRLETEADLQKLVSYIGNKSGTSEFDLQAILTDPPRVVMTGLARSNAKKISAELKKMGCMVKFEPMLTDEAFPFPISQNHYDVMRKELSKTLRVNQVTSLFSIKIHKNSPDQNIPSMLGPLRETLTENFRESDKLIGIDEDRVIVMGLSTDKQHVDGLKDKIGKVFHQVLGDAFRISMGISYFPEEGRNLPKLLRTADLNREDDHKVVSRKASSVGTPFVLAREKGTLTPIQVCFTKARGKIFRRLLDMDPKTLLLGLSQLPEEKQREFLARLSFDSPLLPVLNEAMEAQSDPISDKVAEEDLETIIYYMELEEGLEERKKYQEEILSKLNRVDALPTLPSVASHVLRIASNPDASAQDLTDVIMNDPSLTSTLLKIVNSAFYGFPQKIGTVKQAVVLLGTGEIVALAFGLSTAKLFAASHLKGIYSPKELWRHSMCTGLIADNLCKRLPEYRKLGVFTAGLLHDFGKIILIDHFPELYGRVHMDVKRHGLPLYDLEDEKFGINHAIIGEFLATNWKLPDPLVQAIAFHHQPALAPSYAQFAAIIGLADYLYYEVGALNELEKEITTFPCELTSSHWTFLEQLFPGLDSDHLKTMTQDALEVIRHSHKLFSILD